MTRRALVYALALTLLLSALLPTAVAAADAPSKPLSMAATGDSITRAFNLCFFPFSDCPARSWSTGNNSTVNSHARRLNITGSAFNDAVSGAKMSDLPSQMATVANHDVGYVTILMGGNDVCTDTEAGMTSPDAYELSLRQAMNTLASEPNPPLVYIVSIPNVKMLWEILKDNSSARSAWNSYDICQSLLANPLSMERTDIDRRERVKQRNMELNERLREVCSDPAYPFCRFDGEGIFGTDFVPNDVSTRDYFHPSTAGQAKLADVSYDLGYWASSQLLPVNDAPEASFTASCTGLTCTFTDTSRDGNGWGGNSWRFGALSTAADTVQAQHTFAAAGEYSVTLYAIDGLGATATVTQTVIVSGSGDTAPAPPTGVVATHGDGSVSLMWSANTESDLAGYRVYRSTTDGGPYQLVNGDLLVPESPEPSYSDAGLVNGTTYYYVVRAVDDAGNESANSAQVSATPQSSTSGELTDVHVGDLDGVATRATRGNSWTATVTILVEDAASAPVGGATVSGDWATGGSSSCTTADLTGTCEVSVSLNSKKTTSTTFTVMSVVGDGLNYVQPSNTDPDEPQDSNGTWITVAL